MSPPVLGARSSTRFRSNGHTPLRVSPMLITPHALSNRRSRIFLSCSQEHSCSAECGALGVCQVDTAPSSVEATFSGRHESFQYTKVRFCSLISRSSYSYSCPWYSIHKVKMKSTNHPFEYLHDPTLPTVTRRQYEPWVIQSFGVSGLGCIFSSICWVSGWMHDAALFVRQSAICTWRPRARQTRLHIIGAPSSFCPNLWPSSSNTTASGPSIVHRVLYIEPWLVSWHFCGCPWSS